MNFAMKGIKTTITATIFAVFFFVLVGMMALDVITFDEFKNTITLSTPVAVMIIGWLTKDYDKTHTDD